MLGRIFPKQFDNDYRGYSLAIWLLVAIVLVKFAQGVASMVDAPFIIRAADGIPLDTFGAGAAATVVYMFKAWGLSNALVNLVGAVAILRYRAMVPFVYVLLTIDQVVRRVFVATDPLPRIATTEPPGFVFPINLVLLALLLIGLALSLAKTASEERRSAA